MIRSNNYWFSIGIDERLTEFFLVANLSFRFFFFFLAKQIVYGVANMKNRASEDVICSSVGTDQNWYFYFLQTHFLRNSSI